MKKSKNTHKGTSSTKKRKPATKKHVSRKDEGNVGLPVSPNPFIPPLGATLPGSSEKNTDYPTADRELNLSPLETPQAGFGEFFDDEWDEDTDMTNDILRARDNASDGNHPTKKKDFL